MNSALEEEHDLFTYHNIRRALNHTRKRKIRLRAKNYAKMKIFLLLRTQDFSSETAETESYWMKIVKYFNQIL